MRREPQRVVILVERSRRAPDPVFPTCQQGKESALDAKDGDRPGRDPDQHLHVLLALKEVERDEHHELDLHHPLPHRQSLVDIERKQKGDVHPKDE